MKVKEKIKEYIRVMKMNKTPTKSELFEMAKVCFVGISLLGLVGFVFYLISVLLGL